jgi:hypothetical protein
MSFLNSNSAAAGTAQSGRVVVCAGTVAASEAANEGDTMSLGGFGE